MMLSQIAASASKLMYAETPGFAKPTEASGKIPVDLSGL